MIAISNDFIQIGVKTKGAEFASLIANDTGIEYLWQADPQYWARHSCILFPAIGCQSNDHIKVNHQYYPMPKHGIVRDREFKYELLSEHVLRFVTWSDAITREAYPFDFELECKYTLEDRTVHIDYKVTNQCDQSMPFCLGAHPAFRCPIEEHDLRSDFTLVFECAETLDTLVISESGLISDQKKRILSDTDTLLITDQLFDDDALVFSGFDSDYISFVDGRGVMRLRVHFPGFTQLGIWSKNRKSPFVCIEPWYGMADRVGYDGEFGDKPGAITIAPGESFDCRHSVEVIA